MHKSNICKNLAESKTTILVIAENKKITSRLEEALKLRNINKNTRIHKSTGRNRIKIHDIYIVDQQEASLEEKIKLIRKIYKSNPKASVFLLNENQEIKNIITEDIKNYIGEVKLGAIFEPSISKNEEDLVGIIEYISSIELTKQKITSLWNKLEK